MVGCCFGYFTCGELTYYGKEHKAEKVIFFHVQKVKRGRGG